MPYSCSMIVASPFQSHFPFPAQKLTSSRASDAGRTNLRCSSDIDRFTDQFTNEHLISLSKQGKVKDARQIMEQIMDISKPISHDSYRALFKACEDSKSLQETQRIHEFLREKGSFSVFNSNWMIRLYSEMGSLIDARKVFDEMLKRNLVSWGTIISAYSHRGLVSDSLALFIEMLHRGLKLNSVIYVCLVKCLSDHSVLEIGKQLHCHIIKNGLSCESILNSALLNMYVKCEWLEGAEIVFSSMEEKNVASWTALMVGYITAEMENKVLSLFVKMVDDGPKLDEYVFSTVFRACLRLGNLCFGKQIHSLIVKHGFASSVSAGTPLVDFYLKCQRSDCAFKAFNQIIEPSDVSWSALIAGLCQNNEFDKSLIIFESLRKRKMNLNPFIYTNIFQACASLADLIMGEQVHADAIKRNMIAALQGESSLVTMYSKCGVLDSADKIFECMEERDTVVWTSLIVGYGFQGNGAKALELFEKMQQRNIQPNSVTFIGVLSACSHSGFVVESKQYFQLMSCKYGINPSVEHYNCLIDAYSRAGLVEEAFEIILKMSLQPDATTWKCLLSGCCSYKNLQIGEIAAKNILQIDPSDTAGYVLMFNLYSCFEKWEEAANMRKIMGERNLRKEPGKSWINVGGKVHEFVVGDKNHPRTTEIYAKLDEVSEGFAKFESGFVAEEDVGTNMLGKKQQIFVHSERLAIVFGLLSTPSNKTIRVFKNLRACKDCHEFCKHVSALTARQIVVRDSFRFHHFSCGQCSCKDYW